jgi:predicted RNase H-like HicB family nuclease/DNA-binding XRE family transcriptional regulator
LRDGSFSYRSRLARALRRKAYLTELGDMQYTARIAKEGKQTLVEFPDCPGCQTFADPDEDVIEVARDALEGWLETHLENGDAPPRPRHKHRASSATALIPVRIDPSLAVRLEIRWARQDANLSQSELAKLVGVSRQQISLLEAQGGNVTLGTLERVANALGRELDVSFVSPSAA